MPNSSRIVAVSAVALAIAFLLHAAYLNCLTEDAFITFRFAKNLASGHGLTWNLGETPVEGYTNFLWLLLCALAMKLGFNVLPFSQAVGVIASLLTMIYTYFFARKLLACEPLVALVPCLLLAASGPFATWATSGMETNLFGLLLLGGVYHFASYVRFGSYRNLLICYPLILIATLTRPEGFLVFVVIAASSLALSNKSSNQYVKELLLPALLYIVPFLAYFIWRYNYFGFLLPNTYYAKTGGTLFQYLRGVKYSAYFAFHFILPLLVLMVPLLWEQKWSRVGLALRIRSLRSDLNIRAPLYICTVLITVYTLYIVYVGGDYMAMVRFFVPILPLIYLVAGVVAKALFSSTSGSAGKKCVAGGLLAFALAATLFHSTPADSMVFSKPYLSHGNYRGVQIERWHVARLSLIGKFFDQYKHSSEESIAMSATGAVPYYSNMRAYCFCGLLDPHIAHKTFKNLGKGFPGHEKYDVLHVLKKRPTYIMFTRAFSKKPKSYPHYGDREDQIIRENYNISRVWLRDEKNNDEGYFTFLELKRRDRGRR